MEKQFANIIIDLTTDALNKSFLYKIPDELQGKIKRGDKVIIPFGRGDSDREGFIFELLDENELKEKKFYKEDKYFKNKDAISKLKTIKMKAEGKIAANEILLKLALFMYKEYAAPIANCLNAVLPVKAEVRKNKRQVDVIENYETSDAYDNEIKLNDEQKKIVNDILKCSDKNEFSEHLIFGITGSGKTEVYISIIEETLKKGKEVIVLIPEIALTHQTVIRLKEKFSDSIAIIHSRMSKGEKYIQYKKCEDGFAKILVGPRSALFAPFENLGLVVIDEVHDNSYKSETSPRYETLKVARERCIIQGATLISLSATPNIDLYYKAKNDNKIKLHTLKKRASGEVPEVMLVDMKEEVKKGNTTIFSKRLIDEINQRLDDNEQIMLYMGRRGYDTILTCKDCGQTLMCPHCEVALVSHNDGKMKCHYCGYEMDEPMVCPNCKSRELEKYGMGTEKLEEMCMELFPKARVIRMDKDTTSEKNGHDKIIDKFRKHKADILIGTQMIVKGHDFPNVTLVAIMRADLSLYREDYKAAENAFSLMTQCIGRSGRRGKGLSIIQAYDIDSETLKYAVTQDYEGFYYNEINNRKKLDYPPFSKILTIELTSELEQVLDKAVNDLKLLLDEKNKVGAVVLGPTKGNPERIKDTYIRKIIIKCNNGVENANKETTSHDENKTRNANNDEVVAKQFRKLTNQFLDRFYKNGIVKAIFDIE